MNARMVCQCVDDDQTAILCWCLPDEEITAHRLWQDGEFRRRRWVHNKHKPFILKKKLPESRKIKDMKMKNFKQEEFNNAFFGF